MKKLNLSSLNAAELVRFGKEKRGYITFARPPEFWLQTKFPYLNRVLGSEEYGLAYGKMILLAGFPTSGKTTLAAWLTGLAQEDGADAAWVDGENSFERRHFRNQGMHVGHRVWERIKGKKHLIGYEKIALFWPEYGEFKGIKTNSFIKENPETAEALFDRVEDWMKLQRKLKPNGKRILVVDSVNAFSSEEELLAGFFNQNARTRVSNAVLLNLMSKRWQTLAVHTNTLVILIAQIRTNPMQRFGNPHYVSGGAGIQFYPAVVGWMNRAKGGTIESHGEQIGVQGKLTNYKNKAGGGSVERKKCGYKIYWHGNKPWNFFSAKELKSKSKNQLE